MTVTIYHNPRCSKSRRTLELIRGKSIEPAIVEYLDTPPDEGELQELIELLGIAPRDLMRRKEKLFKALELGDPGLSDSALITAMSANPILIERPVVTANGKAALGRTPEAVLDLL